MADGSLQKTDAVMEGFGGLSIVRQIGMMIGIMASVALGAWMAIWSWEPSYRPLYTDISNIEANQVADILQTEGIRFEIDTHSNLLMVESDKIHEARLKLAAAGYPSGNGIGYELLDQEQSFGTSQFLEKARYHRSLEGELSKTISSIGTVRGARVHLAIPKKTVFVGDERRPSASVLVDLFPGRTLEKGQVASIVHLVASSIPQMRAKDVTVVDQKGTLLSDNEQDESIKLAARNIEFTRKIETLYLERIHNILEPILGSERFKVEVTADVDFTRIEQTSETYNPDLPALRSEQVLDERRGDGPGVGGIPGALSNQPPGNAKVPEEVNGEEGGEGAAAQKANGNSRTQTARNYELDRTISHTRHQTGRLRRLSVAVVVDNIPDLSAVDASSTAEGGDGADGAGKAAATEDQFAQKIKSVPVTEVQLARITLLVKDAIGYDVQRGDSVNVVNQPFLSRLDSLIEEIPSTPWWEEIWFRDLLKQFLVVLLGFFLVFGVLKILGSLAKTTDGTGYDELQMDLAPLSEEDATEEEELAIEGGPESLLPGPEQSYEAQLTAIKNMVASDPRLVAQVVKQWVAND